jgi:hypothetical protein
MLDAKNRLLPATLAVIAGLALAGCESSDGPESPPPPPDTFNALFAPTAAVPVLPFPTDLFFNGTTDLTLNIPAAFAAAPFFLTGPALNTLDGWGTSTSITTSFNQAIDGASLGASSVRVVEMYLSNTTKAPAQGAELPPGVVSPVKKVLTYGTDYTAAVSTDVDTGGKVLKITPLKPFTASSGTTNIGYLVILTSGIKDTEGRTAQPGDTYQSFKSAPADCSTITNATLNALCRLTKAQLSIANAIGVNPADVVLSWSFSTQSVDDPFKALAATVPAQSIAVTATGLTTKQVNAAAQGKANIYVGTTQVPYYLAKPANANDRSFLTSFWVAAGPPPLPLDQTSRFITRFNPIPLNRGTTTIPLLVTVPNATANAGAGCPKPAAGWPVVIVQHGLGGNRTQALAMADSFADACFIVAGMDLPMHGLTDTANPFYQAANERTFNVDLVNNSNTSSYVPDGKIDPSGTHSIPVILSSPLTGRDLLRQGQADIGVLSKTIVKLDVTGDGVADVDPARVHYVGLSLGGIVGLAQAKYAPNMKTVTVSAPGGPITQVMLDSPTFGPTVRGAVAPNFAYNSQLFNNFFRELQTLMDPGDPVNHICQCATNKPLHLMKVNGDTVVPNSTTDNLIRAGGFKKLSTVGPNAVAAGVGAYTTFTKGSHGSLFDPTTSPAATVEMQRQAVLFAASAVQPGGPFVVITDPTVIEP